MGGWAEERKCQLNPHRLGSKPAVLQGLGCSGTWRRGERVEQDLRDNKKAPQWLWERSRLLGAHRCGFDQLVQVTDQ